MAKKFFDNMPEVDRNALAAALNLNPTSFKGLATTSTNPIVSAGVTQWWLASGAGTYTNFGGLVITGNFAVLSYSGSAWSKWETTITAPNVVQTVGTSTTDVMSQKAVVEVVYGDKYQVTLNNTITSKYLNTSGELKSYASFSIKVYDVTNIDFVKIKTYISGSGIAIYGFYSDSACTNLVSVGPAITSGVITTYDFVQKPSGALYLGISFQNSGGSLYVTEKCGIIHYVDDSVKYFTKTKYNIFGKTEDLASAYFTSSGTKGSEFIMFKGIKLTKLTLTNFYHNLITQWSGLGLAPFTIGKKYLASFYVTNLSNSEQFLWNRGLGNTSSRGHSQKLIDGSVRRIWVLCYATATNKLVVVENPTLAMSAQTADMYWLYLGSTGGSGTADLRVGGFQIEEVSNNSYVDGIAQIGDSTMQGSSGTNDNMVAREISTYLAGLLNVPVYNRAIGGNTTQNMIDRWATDITPIALNCKYCLIQGGINDLAYSITVATIKTNIQTLYNNAVTDGMIPIVMTITPANTHIVQTGREADRITLNNWIKSTFPIVFDIASVVENPSNVQALRTEWAGDGTHYNVYGKRAIANACALWDGWDFITPKPYQQILNVIGTDITLEDRFDRKIGEIAKVKGIRVFAASNNIDITGRYQML